MADLRTRRLAAGLGAVLILGAAAVILVFDPTRTRILPGCPFHALTGFYCPGCGSSRALYELLHGRLVAALDDNLLTVLALPFLALSFARYAAAAVSGKPAPRTALDPGRIWGILAVILVFGVARNFPWAPFSWLAP